jgi:hypothetical protein
MIKLSIKILNKEYKFQSKYLKEKDNLGDQVVDEDNIEFDDKSCK